MPDERAALAETIEGLLELHVPRDLAACDAGDWTPYGEHGTTWNWHLACALAAGVHLAPSAEAVTAPLDVDVLAEAIGTIEMLMVHSTLALGSPEWLTAADTVARLAAEPRR